MHSGRQEPKIVRLIRTKKPVSLYLAGFVLSDGLGGRNFRRYAVFFKLRQSGDFFFIGSAQRRQAHTAVTNTNQQIDNPVFDKDRLNIIIGIIGKAFRLHKKKKKKILQFGILLQMPFNLRNDIIIIVFVKI